MVYMIAFFSENVHILYVPEMVRNCMLLLLITTSDPIEILSNSVCILQLS